MLVAAVTAVLVAALLAGEYTGSFALRAVSKTLASLGFVVHAIVAGALDAGAPGVAVVVALVLSAIGDVFLLWRERGPFLAGIVAFLLGHLGFGAAFALLGTSLPGLLAGAVVLAPIAGGAWVLFGRRAGPLAPAVGAYILVITSMVALGAGSTWADPSRWDLLLAAVAFFASDLCVARDRFVAPGFANRLVGLPLYYGAQLLFGYAIA